MSLAGERTRSLRSSTGPITLAAPSAASADTPPSLTMPSKISTSNADRNAKAGLSNSSAAAMTQQAQLGRVFMGCPVSVRRDHVSPRIVADLLSERREG